MHRVCMGAMSSVIYMTLPQQRHTLGAGIFTSLFLGISAGIFGSCTVAIGEALTHLFKHPLGYRHIVDRGAAALVTQGNVFW